MFVWITLPVSGVTAITNRLWRGEGEIARWQWYTFMVVLSVAVAFSFTQWQLYLIWLLYYLGYAALPWQAMFSAITGEPPSRQDAWWFQWVQDLAYKICNMDPNAPPGTYTSQQWMQFGRVYGALRAAFMLPGVFLLAGYSHSPVPLSGILCLLMGVVYWLGGVFSRHELNNNSIGVCMSEITMGWWLGTYMLICATVI